MIFKNFVIKETEIKLCEKTKTSKHPKTSKLDALEEAATFTRQSHYQDCLSKQIQYDQSTFIEN